jgi:hypothetical protein
MVYRKPQPTKTERARWQPSRSCLQLRKKCLTSAASLSVLVHKAHEMSFAPHRSYAQSVLLYVVGI